MDSAIEKWWSSDESPRTRSSFASPSASYPKRRRRNQVDSVCCSVEHEHNKWKLSSKVVDRCDPFALCNLEEGLDHEKFGSVAKEIEDLIARRGQVLNKLYAHDISSPCGTLDVGRHCDEDSNVSISHVIDLEDEHQEHNLPPAMPIPTVDISPSIPLVILDSDNEDCGSEMSNCPYQGNISKNTGDDIHKNDTMECDNAGHQTLSGGATLCSGNGKKKDGGVYVGVEDEENKQPDADGVDDIWKEMSFVLEYSKDTTVDLLSENRAIKDGEEDCDHFFIMKDDIGTVCRICGYIEKSIETIIDLQFGKATRSTRTYRYEERKAVGPRSTEIQHDGTKSSKEDFMEEICAHPRHKKQMKAHQIEGFNFLLSNLVTDSPSGCILAHAPGSGKTFMIISFLQSFMARYPHARPLVVLPKGILATWKKEFRRWQVEDLALYDFYSAKAENRSQQLELLRHWSAERSILFLGYKQFSSIVCDNDTTNTTAECRMILLTCPSILILDEGHTPRNEETNTLTALEKVQTPRKVVLSGTLYQNNVREVFNILNLVKPKFLKLDTSKAVKKRILSRASISGRHNLVKDVSDREFYELVEHTLFEDKNLSRKVTIIKDLREMTSKVLHYYKGDFLEELPGLVDFTVLLKLHQRQKSEVAKLKKLKQKFKVSSEGSAIYVHPKLKCLCGSRERFDEKKIDMILEDLEEQEGVKTKFYLNLLQLCESRGEKLLVFSQYLLPMKFLERLTVKLKGYSVGKEIFMITGDADSGMRESSMEQFNTSADARVFFGSIRACGEGISLVGASRVLVLDVHPNPSVTRQAIGRAFRPGQQKKVYTYRLVASGSPEEEDHSTCFRKESIAKLWFEWNEYDGHCDFQMEEVDVKTCGDMFLETPCLSEDVISLFKR
ncbi:protein CHROMATIN REMODELING 35-like [Ipomoea triloba]|uniref:protein CHROMATIN REMODELING 35-like n=1 Tax=Ipomoea triloba TaxID=35885 RepID=UPI00125DCFD6|nr:protein CHROMATIN REMODELING 35-like [Ipomoea triloba]